MTLARLVVRELGRRRFGAGLATAGVAVASAFLVTMSVLFRTQGVRAAERLAAQELAVTERLAELQFHVRKAMTHLGANLRVLPAGQSLGDWHVGDTGTATLPEEAAARLGEAELPMVERLVPLLRRRLQWPETEWTVMGVGIGDGAPLSHARAASAGRSPVPAGRVRLGYEIHHALGFKTGASLRLQGREFIVEACLIEEGTRDDVTVWMNLRDAQELAGMPGRINEIEVWETQWTAASVAAVKEAVARALPGAQVVENRAFADARIHALRESAEQAAAALQQERAEKEATARKSRRLTATIGPLVAAASAVWMACLAAANARDRRTELALHRALGLRPAAVAALMLGRVLLVAGAGGLAGCALGAAAGSWFAGAATLAPGAWPPALLVAVGGSVIGALGPLVRAAREDPATALSRGEG